MNDDILQLLKILLAVVPFVLLALLNNKANLKQKDRSRQFLMPIFAVVFCVIVGLFLAQINAWIVDFFNNLSTWLDSASEWLTTAMDGALAGLADTVSSLADKADSFIGSLDVPFWAEILANGLIIVVYLIVKKIAVLLMKPFAKDGNRLYTSIAGLVYEKNERKKNWFVKPQLGQGITLMKTLYYTSIVFSVLGIWITAFLYENDLIASLYYPVFSVILVGELYFYLDGPFYEEEHSSLTGEADNAMFVCDYSLMRNVLRRLFGDKLISENTTVSSDLVTFRTNDECIAMLEDDDEAVIEAYGRFMRRRAADGLSIDQNYLTSGLELLKGRSILFNNPFYYDLIPYIFYPINRTILRRKKVLVVLGRHAIENDVIEWCRKGLASVNHIPSLWNIGVLGNEESDFDVGIVTRSCVHDLKMHEANAAFFADVEFVVLIEPSRLVTTAQIGLNSLVRHCRKGGKTPVFCSTDKNCDGIVDSLSHILMTSLEEVSATNHHKGASSYMCWEVDDEHLQHRMLPNLSRYLGIGTELSFAALKNQVSKTSWYGGEAFPVTDMHWIAKQYYYDLLHYASLPTMQSMVDEVFRASPNMWNAGVADYNYITVEDESCNMFEVRREFSTRTGEQGFINVISTDYLLRDYMAANDGIFNADPKAIPYIAADYAHTERNVIYRLCLRLAAHPVSEEDVAHELALVDLAGEDVFAALWHAICKCSHGVGETVTGAEGEEQLCIRTQGQEYRFSSSVVQTERKYMYELGKMQTLYRIQDPVFIQVFLGDLCSASYIAEDENGNDLYLGAELRGHVFQKYLPGQFFTFDGKYYEMLRMTADGRVLVRRAADHIDGRVQYRQVRDYTLTALADSETMGDARDIGGVRVVKQYADFRVDTPAYWTMPRYNDFETGKRIDFNGAPRREYRNKQVLKIEFGEQLGVTPTVCNTVALLMNEVFRTLYAENQGMIVAVTAAEAEAPLTYSLHSEGIPAPSANCIYVIEDSQLDIGLLVSVERNLNRIFSIICDYLDWHTETLEESLHPPVPEERPDFTAAANPKEKGGAVKKAAKAVGNFFKKIGSGIGRFFKKIGEWFKKLFRRKPKDPAPEEPTVDEGTEPTVDTPEGTGTPIAPATPDTDNGKGTPDDGEGDGEPINDSNVLCQTAPARRILAEASEGGDGETAEGAYTIEWERRPYHERYYLLYGGEQVPQNIDPAAAAALLHRLGYADGSLTQARHGKDEAELIAQSYDPTRTGSHYCDFCGVELLGMEYEVLADGRERCIACGRTAVKTEQEFKAIYDTVIRNLKVFYGISINEPVTIEMVNAQKLHKRLNKSFVPTGNADGRILGVAIKGKEGYTILLENGSPRLSATMTMVHELTHIWQYLNWDAKQIRKLYGKDQELEIYEGMAKWSEIQYAYLINEAATAKREEILTCARDDEYGHGFLKYLACYPLSSGNHLKGASPFDDPKKPL